MTISIPSPGLGTSGNTDETTCIQTMQTAIDLGYRHIDTAQMYDNESFVRAGIQESAVDREDVFLATKIHPENLGADDVRSSFEVSLDRLDTSYVDLLYVHWPLGEYDAETTLPAFDNLRDDGAIDHVGVSNFSPALLEEAREVLDAPIAAHQVERHPLLPQPELVDIARDWGHSLVAYAPIMKGRFEGVDVIQEIAAENGVTPAQVCLAWQFATDGVVPIPKATGDHIQENWVAQDVTLSGDELRRINQLEAQKRFVDPDTAPWNR